MKKILLIDDEVSYAESIGEFFKIKQYDYVYETDADLALEAYKKERPDIILLDLNLGAGKKNGLDILKEIREIDSQIKIIVISGEKGSGMYEGKVEALGADAFMGKPLDIFALLKIIE